MVGIEIIAIVGMLLLIAGFVLVGIEMILPGFSIPGISGIVCLIAGVFCLADTFAEGAIITVIVLALLGVMMAVILWLLSHGKLRSPIILQEEQKKDKGYISSNDLHYLLGKTGVTATDLRPSGIARIEDVNFDVLSEGAYIKKDTRIKIIKVQGSKIMVVEV